MLIMALYRKFAEIDDEGSVSFEERRQQMDGSIVGYGCVLGTFSGRHAGEAQAEPMLQMWLLLALPNPSPLSHLLPVSQSLLHSAFSFACAYQTCVRSIKSSSWMRGQPERSTHSMPVTVIMDRKGFRSTHELSRVKTWIWITSAPLTSCVTIAFTNLWVGDNTNKHLMVVTQEAVQLLLFPQPCLKK